MYDTTDFRKGLKVEHEQKVWVMLKCDHVNPGKGSAFVKVRMKNLETLQVLEKTFKVGQATNCTDPGLEEKEVAYMYADTDGFNFMDQSNFESIHVSNEDIDDNKFYLKEGIKIHLAYYKGRPIAVDLPNFVDLLVTETDPGLKGDTATGGTKKATMETGLQINVPLFIKEGELLKIDTRTGSYVERASTK